MSTDATFLNTPSTDIVAAFDQLALALSDFCQTLKQSRANCWVALGENEAHIDPLDKACSYYQDIWYKDQQDGRETRSCYGVVMASEEIIERAHRVNHAKDAFKALVQQAQKTDKDGWLEQKSLLNRRHESLRQQLYYTGLARIHLKQIYRHIPILPLSPEKIGFSWYCNGRSIKKMSVAQAQDKLLAIGEEKEHIQQQLKKLNTLPAHEILAQIQSQVPVVRANLVYKVRNEKGHADTVRKAMNVSLPLLVPDNNHHLLPTFNQINDQPPETRTRIARSDFKISEEVFLPSLRVHRYL